jgi:hypothetical protein
MKKRRVPILVSIATVSVLFGASQVSPQSIGVAQVSTLSGDLVSLVQSGLAILNATPEPLDDPTDPPGFFQVKPQEFDPARTDLVQAAWINSIGCPTNAIIANPNADFTAVASTSPYFDPACAIGDSRDQRHQGLLLAKTGPTSNFAAAVAELHRVKGITLTELGWDIRKAGVSAGPLGSHCGAGGPRWNIITADGQGHFLGCNSPPATQQVPGNGWIRMRWDAVGLAGAFPPIVPGNVILRIQILLDEGQDTGPDFFGAAVLDNINVNGVRVGHGATDAS